MEELFGSDSSDGKVSSYSGSPRSDDEKSAQSEQSVHSEPEGDDGQVAISEREVSGSDDERNVSDGEQSYQSEARSNRSPDGSVRSHQSGAEYEEEEEQNEEEDEQNEEEEDHEEYEQNEASARSDVDSDVEGKINQDEMEHSEREASDQEVEHSGSEMQHHSEVESEVHEEHSDQSDAEEARDNSEDEAQVQSDEGQDQSEAGDQSEGETKEEESGHMDEAHSDYENDQQQYSVRSHSERDSENESRHSDQEMKSSDDEQYSRKRRRSVSSTQGSGSPKSNEDEEGEGIARKIARISDGEEEENMFAGEDHRSAKDSEDENRQEEHAENMFNSDKSQSGSDDEIKHKKSRVIRDDDDENSGEGGNIGSPSAHDIFGEDLGDISSDEERQAESKREETTIDNEEGDRERLMNGDLPVPEEEEPVPETRIEVEIPRIMTNLGKELHFIKLPNFLSVDTKSYDPQWYEDEIDEDEVLDEEGRARLKLKVENTVRWRYTYDDLGNAIKESNARIVRWSDGSLSLHLGSEIFDVHWQPVTPGDHNHLFIRQGTGLQGQAVFQTKLTFRPHSTDSFTHRKMVYSLADRNQKTQKIRVLPNVGQDPEAHRSEMIKKEEDRLKASIRRENKQRRMREKSHSRGLTSSYLEPDRYEEEDDGAISLAAIKNKYKKGAAVRDQQPIYSSDDDDEDSQEEQRAKKLEQAKSLDDNDDEDEDSDLDYFDKKKAAIEGKKKVATIQESDEDS